LIGAGLSGCLERYENLTLRELAWSSTAERLGIDNTPSERVVERLPLQEELRVGVDTQPIDLNSAALGIGRHVTGQADPFKGRIDEFRIAHIQASDGWIETTWNNMSDPGAFAAAGAEEQEGGSRQRLPTPARLSASWGECETSMQTAFGTGSLRQAVAAGCRRRRAGRWSLSPGVST
jgi:hypothetical protein